MAVTPPLLEVRDLRIAFDDESPVVDGISFDLKRGESLGLVGVSGSGKSITAAALLGLLSPSARVVSGSAQYHSGDEPPVDLLRLNEQQWRDFRGQELSLIFQEPQSALNPVHRCGRQIKEAVRATNPGSKDPDNKVDRLLDLVDLGRERGRIKRAYPHELSGGQLQRIMIAIALAGSPKVLFADEPTTALDSITEAEIVRLLNQLRQELGMALVFITHDLPLLETITDEVAVIRRGNLILRGSTAELLTQPEHGYLKWLLAGGVGEEPSTVNEAGGGVITDDISLPLLEVENLTITYEKSSAPAVDGVSFVIYRGEWLALVGPSGCGKSSVARYLVGLVTGQSARQTVGVRVQLIFQSAYASLNPKIRVGALLAEVLTFSAAGGSAGKRTRREAIEQARRLLGSVGLDAEEFYDRLPDQLSGGQRQRVAIARALAADPELLICDEAVSALDAPLRREVLDLLEHISRQSGIALLFITHDLRLVADRADRVLVMAEGEIVERGSAVAVIQTPKSAMGRRLVAAARL